MTNSTSTKQTFDDALLAIGSGELRSILPVGRTTLYKLLSEGALPSIKIGRRRFLRAGDVKAFIASRVEGGAA